MFFNQKLKNQRGMILGLVLVICFILGVLAFESERLALHLRNETGLIKQGVIPHVP
jgi:hypothetical protein